MKRICLLTIILALCVFILTFVPLKINATTINESEIEDTAETVIEGEGDASVASSGEGWGHPDNHGEEWYTLSTTEPVFGNQVVEIDYDQMPELLTHLKPDDINFSKNKKIQNIWRKNIKKR